MAYFCVDHTDVWMATRLNGKDTYFLPFNIGRGEGINTGAGNPDFNGKYPVRKSIQTEFAHVGGKDGLLFQADAVAYCGK